MNKVDTNGMLTNPRVIPRRFPSIEHGRLLAVRAIVIHQTDAPTATATFNAYRTGSNRGNGAHFLVDKNGTIYQTASLHMRCYHVGTLIKSKCLEINKTTCKDPALAKAKLLGWKAQIAKIDVIERTKTYSHRFPINSDSVGIELVGKHTSTTTYEAVTHQQNASLQWLIDELYAIFSLSSADIYRHPQVSYKNPGEAAGAVWK